MTGIDWTAVGGVAAVATLLASILALMIQVRSLRKSIESSTYQEMIRTFNDFSVLLVDKPEMEKYVFSEKALPDGIDKDDSTRAQWMIAMRFVWFESIVVQKKIYSALHKDIYRHWLEILKFELSTASMEQYWRKYNDKFHPVLRKVVWQLRPDLRPVIANRKLAVKLLRWLSPDL